MIKRVIITIVLVLVTANCFSQIYETITDGYQIFRYPNGAISSEGILKDGKPEGYWKSYYVTGILKSEGKRTNYLLDSIWVFYNNYGDTTEKINYLYGKKNGYYYKYNKNPQVGIYVESQELYVDDKKEGNAYYYFPTGEIKQSIPYDSNQKNGLSIEYDKEGRIISLYEYNKDRLISRERINRTDNNGLKQGVWKDFFPSGSLRKEENFRDNLLHGYYREYDEKGKTIITLLYDGGSIVESVNDNDTDIDIINRYGENNVLIYSGPYRNDVPVGIHREYSDDGSIINSYIYNDNGLLVSEGIVDESGNRNGSWKEYYENGSVRSEGQYNNNVRIGNWKFFDNDGNIEQTGSYINGRPDGSWRWYFENNLLLREEEYYRGERDGLYTEYSITGNIIVQGEYLDGEKNGFWRYNTGDMIEEGEYILGLKEGLWQSYYPDETLKYKGRYVQGNPNGTHQYYYDNGSIKEEQYYRMGVKQKTWRKYNEEGVIVLAVSYKNDREININGIRVDLPESDIRLIE